jgi:hypothetical protein
MVRQLAIGDGRSALAETGCRRSSSECIWPGVDQRPVDMLNRRAVAAAWAARRRWSGGRFVGSSLLHADEMVLCELEGEKAVGRRVSKAADIPLARIVKSASLPRDR